MDHVETEGNSIDEAIENALRAMGVERAKVEIEILSNASRGLFGIGGKRARVRATLRKPVPEIRATASRTRPVEIAEAVAARPDRPSGGDGVPAGARGDGVARARDLLAGIVGRMGFAATVDAERRDDQVVLNIAGDGSDILIGKHGQTLDAIEYLVNRVLGREDDGGARIAVDCEQYRLRRERSLELMARKLGERAKRRGKPVTVNPLSPRDRRIVHLALQGDPHLTTRSLGGGYLRKLVIIPGGERRASQAEPR